MFEIVKKNQLLAKIDDGGLGQQLAQLKIQTNRAKTTIEQQERLWKQKIGSEIQYLQAKSNYEAQREQINQLNSQLAKTEVRAPFDGTIDDVITDQGNVVAAGITPLIRIVNLNEMYIETNVPEAYLSSVVQGKTVYVDFPILNKTITTPGVLRPIDKEVYKPILKELETYGVQFNEEKKEYLGYNPDNLD